MRAHRLCLCAHTLSNVESHYYVPQLARRTWTMSLPSELVLQYSCSAARKCSTRFKKKKKKLPTFSDNVSLFLFFCGDILTPLPPLSNFRRSGSERCTTPSSVFEPETIQRLWGFIFRTEFIVILEHWILQRLSTTICRQNRNRTIHFDTGKIGKCLVFTNPRSTVRWPAAAFVELNLAGEFLSVY